MFISGAATTFVWAVLALRTQFISDLNWRMFTWAERTPEGGFVSSPLSQFWIKFWVLASFLIQEGQNFIQSNSSTQRHLNQLRSSWIWWQTRGGQLVLDKEFSKTHLKEKHSIFPTWCCREHHDLSRALSHLPLFLSHISAVTMGCPAHNVFYLQSSQRLPQRGNSSGIKSLSSGIVTP